MQIFKSIKEIQTYLDKQRGSSKLVGFVPTMGALHEGHLSLIKRCSQKQDTCVVSIFVNPTQFNNPDDLEKYPRTIDADCRKLETTACNAVFVPDIKEMYPDEQSFQSKFDFGYLESVYEGQFRPRHFKGVGQIVARLLSIIQPNAIYLGNKDYQQLLIIKQLVDRHLNMQLDVIGCPIVREPDGLAMSSRNRLLTQKQRTDACAISKTLQFVKDKAPTVNPRQLAEFGRKSLEAIVSILQVEYFDLVDSDTLLPVSAWIEGQKVRAITAVQMKGVRLIDNMEIK